MVEAVVIAHARFVVLLAPLLPLVPAVVRQPVAVLVFPLCEQGTTGAVLTEVEGRVAVRAADS